MPDQEVPSDKLSDDQRKLYEGALNRPNVTVVDYEKPIIDLSTEILDSCRTVDIPMHFCDALHLATAINKEADAFYTFDGGKKGGADLLSLDGSAHVHGLKICKPPFQQMPLLFPPT